MAEPPPLSGALYRGIHKETDFRGVFAVENRLDEVRYLYWQWPRTGGRTRASLDRRVRMTSIDDEAAALRLIIAGTPAS